MGKPTYDEVIDTLEQHSSEEIIEAILSTLPKDRADEIRKVFENARQEFEENNGQD